MCKVTTLLTLQCIKTGFVASQDVWNIIIISHQIQTAKKEQRNLHLAFLDLLSEVLHLWSISTQLPVDSLQFFLCPKENHGVGQDLFSGYPVLRQNTEQHHRLATSGKRHHGRQHHFPYGICHKLTSLYLWFRKDPSCPLCTALATLQHILDGCKTSLTQGRHTW